MSLEKGLLTDKIIKEMDGFSGAEIKAVVTEAGYFAIRSARTQVTFKDFKRAIKKVQEKEEMEGQDYLDMFG